MTKPQRAARGEAGRLWRLTVERLDLERLDLERSTREALGG